MATKITNKQKYEDLISKGHIVCSTWKRGCFNDITDNFDMFELSRER